MSKRMITLLAIVAAGIGALGMSATSREAAAASQDNAVCVDGSCTWGCTGGADCWAFAKCVGGVCKPTVMDTTCKGELVLD